MILLFCQNEIVNFSSEIYFYDLGSTSTRTNDDSELSNIFITMAFMRISLFFNIAELYMSCELSFSASFLLNS